jgi:hypothetical protein
MSKKSKVTVIHRDIAKVAKAGRRPGEPRCPECEKMVKVRAQSQAQGEFLDWLQAEKEWTLCVPHRHTDECFTLGLAPKQLVKQYGQYLSVGEKADGRFHTPQCGLQDRQFLPVSFTMEQLLADFHGINLKKVEKERRALLDFVRKANG